MRELVVNVLVIIFLTTVLDLLLPGGQMQPFIRMVMGLFVLVTLLQPLLQLVNDDSWLDSWILTENLTADGESVMAQGEDLYAQANEEVLRTYEGQLEKQIGSLVLLLDDVEQCRAEVLLSADERLGNVARIEAVTIYIDKDPHALGQAVEEKAQALICGYYDLAAETVKVKARGE